MTVTLHDLAGEKIFSQELASSQVVSKSEVRDIARGRTGAPLGAQATPVISALRRAPSGAVRGQTRLELLSRAPIEFTMPNPGFTPATLAFLRALKRNNDREWFKARKERYERDVREPMIQVIERLAVDFKTFAPELVASPKASLYRIYRDTRFSGDKTPLKTNVAANFPWRGLHRHQGAGLYFEIAPAWVWIGGGMYAPEPAQLVKVREHIAETFPEIRTLSRARAFVKHFGALDGAKLTRVPRGYAADHPRRTSSATSSSWPAASCPPASRRATISTRSCWPRSRPPCR